MNTELDFSVSLTSYSAAAEKFPGGTFNRHYNKEKKFKIQIVHIIIFKNGKRSIKLLCKHHSSFQNESEGNVTRRMTHSIYDTGRFTRYFSGSSILQ